MSTGHDSNRKQISQILYLPLINPGTEGAFLSKQVRLIKLLSSKAQFSLKIDIQLKVTCLNGLTQHRKPSQSDVEDFDNLSLCICQWHLSAQSIGASAYNLSSAINYRVPSTKINTGDNFQVRISSPFAPDLFHNHSSLFPSTQNDNKPTHIAKSNTEHCHASAYFWQNLVP